MLMARSKKMFRIGSATILQDEPPGGVSANGQKDRLVISVLKNPVTSLTRLQNSPAGTSSLCGIFKV